MESCPCLVIHLAFRHDVLDVFFQLVMSRILRVCGRHRRPGWSLYLPFLVRAGGSQETAICKCRGVTSQNAALGLDCRTAQRSETMSKAAGTNAARYHVNQMAAESRGQHPSTCRDTRNRDRGQRLTRPACARTCARGNRQRRRTPTNNTRRPNRDPKPSDGHQRPHNQQIKR